MILGIALHKFENSKEAIKLIFCTLKLSTTLSQPCQERVHWTGLEMGGLDR